MSELADLSTCFSCSKSILYWSCYSWIFEMSICVCSFRARKWAEQVEFGQSASNPWRWYTALPPMFEQSLWDLSRAAQLWNYFTYKISASFSPRAAERRVCRLGMKVVCRACVDVVMKCNTSDQGRWRGRAEKWRKEVNHLPSGEEKDAVERRKSER